MPPALPPLLEPFDAAFRALLPLLLSTRGRVDAGRVERLRARRAVLSQSGTFVGHRRYERGDDLRRLDWSAYARTGELFTKQLEEEDRRAVTVIVDVSPSMLAGAPQRRFGALRLAAVVAGLALARLDGVQVVAPGKALARARFAGIAELPQLLEHLRALPVAAACSPDECAAAALHGDAIGRVHWISDFAPPQGFARPLLSLRRRGAKVSGWLPVVAGDEAPPAGGYLRVCDPETHQELAVPVDAALAQQLAVQLARLARQQRQMFAEAGCPLWRWTVPQEHERPELLDYLPIVAACAR